VVELLKAAKVYDVNILCVVRGEANEKQLLHELLHPRHLVVRSDVEVFFMMCLIALNL
jgi:hypothetical protein